MGIANIYSFFNNTLCDREKCDLRTDILDTDLNVTRGKVQVAFKTFTRKLDQEIVAKKILANIASYDDSNLDEDQKITLYENLQRLALGVGGDVGYRLLISTLEKEFGREAVSKALKELGSIFLEKQDLIDLISKCKGTPERLKFQAEWPSNVPRTATSDTSIFSKILRAVRHFAFSYIILPGSRFENKNILELQGEYLLNEYNGKKVTITTPDGVKLDAVLFGDHNEDAVILGLGNAQQWETTLEVELDNYLNQGVAVLIVNPRSVGNSDQVCPDAKGLALDMYSGYEFLKKSQQKEKILFIGCSMGGATTALGAALVQQQYPDEEISAINNRSFSKLSAVAVELYNKYVPLPLHSFFDDGFTIGFLLLAILHLLGAELDSETAFNQLKGDRVIFWVENDDRIPHPAQMKEPERNENMLSIYQMDPKPGSPHHRYFTENEQEDLNNEINNLLGRPIQI